MLFKDIAGAIGIILGFIAFAPYILSILQNKTKPHAFSWAIWALSTLLVGFATLAKGGGNGAYIIIFSGAVSFGIFILSLIKSSDIKIYKSDWLNLIFALLSMPLWYVTKDPFWAVALLTFIDLMGYLPTIRKIKDDPFSENMTMYTIVVIRNLFIIAATKEYNATTLMFNILTCAATAMTIIYALILRQQKRIY